MQVRATDLVIRRSTHGHVGVLAVDGRRRRLKVDLQARHDALLFDDGDLQAWPNQIETVSARFISCSNLVPKIHFRFINSDPTRIGLLGLFSK